MVGESVWKGSTYLAFIMEIC